MRLTNFIRVVAFAVGAATSTLAQAADISGAGATFPFPIYAKWADAYKKDTGNGLNYQSIGSGAGIKQIKARTVTFGATDAPLEPAELEKDGLAQWPMVMGGIVAVVNLPGVKPGDIVIDGPTLAQIYLGKITNWNDPALKTLNPKLDLPDLPIVPIHRADGSGTTFNFTYYLGEVSPDWKSKVGVATTVDWPGGIGAKGNDGVANNVATTKGAIGYVEFAYAEQNKLTFASMANKAGKVVAPTMEAFQAAAANADWDSCAWLLSHPGQSAGRQVVADDRRHIHSLAQGSAEQGRRERRNRLLQVGLREGRQDGRGPRLYPDARQRRGAGREDVGGRHQAISVNRPAAGTRPRERLPAPELPKQGKAEDQR